MNDALTICDLCIINDLCFRIANDECRIEYGLGKIEGPYRIKNDDDDVYGPNYKCSYKDKDKSSDSGHAIGKPLPEVREGNETSHYRIFR